MIAWIGRDYLDEFIRGKLDEWTAQSMDQDKNIG